MKSNSWFPMALIVVLIILGTYFIDGYVSAMQPAWDMEYQQKSTLAAQHQAQLDKIEVREEDQRARDWTEVQRMFLVIIVLGVGGWLGVAVWSKYDRRREAWARPVDGTFALQNFSNGQVTWVVDPNKSVSGAIGFSKPTGLLGEFSSQTMGPDRQLSYAHDVQKTRTVSAANAENGIKYAAHAKFLAGSYDKPLRPTEYPQLATTDDNVDATWQPLQLTDAFAQSDLHSWILGQNRQDGTLFKLNPKESAHFGIVGATGTGKTTYVGLLLMAYALKYGFRIVVLDGKGGADWSKFSSFVEYYRLDYTNVQSFIAQMVKEYDQRQELLNDYGANSIWELPKDINIPRPTFFLIDEFGRVMDSLKAANRNQYKHVEIDLSNLLRLSRGAGMYVTLFDQNPTKWPGTVRANLPMNLCFRLGGGIGAAINEYNVDRLDRVGHFQVDGTDYHAWPTFEVIDHLVPKGYQKPKALLSEMSVRPSVDLDGEDAGDTTPLAADGRTDGQADSLADTEGTDLQQAVLRWRRENPAGSQADCRRAMAAKGLTLSKQYASDLWRLPVGAGDNQDEI